MMGKKNKKANFTKTNKIFQLVRTLNVSEHINVVNLKAWTLSGWRLSQKERTLRHYLYKPICKYIYRERKSKC